MSLKGTQTEANLQQAFARDSESNRRYLYFAQQAEIDGYPEIASVFRNVADGQTGHAHGHLDYLASLGSGDPTTGLPIGETELNVNAAIAAEIYESDEMFPKFADAARSEGFTEIADWFETLARAEKMHATRLQAGRDAINGHGSH